MPPVTEPTVHQAASRNARSGRASDIGTSITSGGIGKKELSTNATAVNIARAWRRQAASPRAIDRGGVCRKLLLADSARRDAGADVVGAARPGVPARRLVYSCLGRGRHRRLRYRG